MADSSRSSPDLTWVYISGAAFVAVLVVATLLIAFAERLTFISNAAYFILLTPLALAAAAFLFGAMRSHARYKGSIPHGTLQLGGPVVVFALVMLGGLLLANPASTSTITVRLTDSADPARPISSGEVVLDLGDDRRTRAVGPDGQVTFSQVPSAFLAGEVNVLPRVERYRAVTGGTVRVPPNRVIEVLLERIPDSTTVSGTLFDAVGPVSGGLVNFADGLVTARSDSIGNFRVTLPLEAGRVVPVTVTLDGRTVYDDNFVVAPEPGLRIMVRRDSR